MAKVTSKYQVTVPRAIAVQYEIKPGDEIDWVPAGDAIRVVPHRPRKVAVRGASPVRVFDQATARHVARSSARPAKRTRERGWSREELYTRGRAR